MTFMCPRCAAPLATNAATCAACGQPLDGLPSPAQAWPVTQATPAWPPTGAVSAAPMPPQPAASPTTAMPPFASAPWQGAGAPYGAPGFASAPAPPRPARSGAAPVIALAAVVAVAGAGVGAALYRRGEPRSEARPLQPPPAAFAPAAPKPAAPPTTVLENNVQRSALPSVGMAGVHYQASVEAPSSALGQPDGSAATVRAGVITLQMAPGQQLVSDGTSAPDVRVECGPSAPGPYRVEIGVGHNRFVLVADGVQGSASVDLDQAGVRVGRFVRVSTRASGAVLALDAVLVRTPAAPAVTP